LSKNPESPKKLEIQQRASYAQSLLEQGVKPAIAATMVSARFQCSRSTAYASITEASNKIQTSDDGPASDEPAIHPESVAAQLTHLFNVACATGDAKQACQLLKSMDTVRKWSAPLQTTANPFV
jgi:hypothetical protein